MGIVQCLFNLLYYVIGVRNTKKLPNYKTAQELAILSACCAEDGLTRFQAKDEFVEYASRLSIRFCLFLLMVRFLKSVGKFYYYPKKRGTVIEACLT